MKRGTAAGVVLALTAAALLAGWGASQGVRVLVALPDGDTVELIAGTPGAEGAEAEEPTASRARPTPRARSKRQYIDGILRRNIFDHTAVNQVSSDVESGTMTDLKVRLIATIVAVPASYSSALIAEDKRDAEAFGYGVGDDLMGAEIIAIEKRRVTIRRPDGSIEYLAMDEDDERPRTTTRTVDDDDDDDEGISEVGENRYAVDRSLIDRYTNDLDAIGRMGRAIPHRGRDGEVDGYRLSAIRRNSLAEQLGIRNGDIVHSVNGQGLTSMQGAMGAYSALQSESSFTFEITRRGKKMTLEYEVR